MLRQAACARSLDGMSALDAPGVAMVFQAGVMPAVFSTSGVAGVNRAVPITSDSLFRVGSLTKPFTAAAVADLVQQRLLQWDDCVSDYIPELASLLDGVRVRHLVYHTSGLRDYPSLDSLAGVAPTADMEGMWTLLRRQQARNFPPGSSFLYSNTGYFLLGQIVERVTGAVFPKVVKDRVLRRLGMTASSFERDDAFDHPARVFGHVRECAAEPHRPFVNREVFFGSSGLFTSIADLLAWSRALRAAWANPESGHVARIMIAPGYLDDGRPLTFGCGVARSVQFGEDALVASGCYGGYSGFFLYLLRSDIVAIVLANSNDVTFGACTRMLAELLEGGTPISERDSDRTPWPGACEPTLPGATLEQFAGTFVSDELSAIFTIEVEGDSLVLVRPARVPEPWPALRGGRLVITCSVAASDPVTSFTISSRFARGLLCRRVAASERRSHGGAAPRRMVRMHCVRSLPGASPDTSQQLVFAPDDQIR